MIAPVIHVPLFGLPAADDVAERLRALQRFLPFHALGLVLGSGAIHQCLLLFDGFG
ncbi:MAG TPA: hypothetical protein VHF69_04945 [Candidatus Synoicihabitans sp.]|nr:hypothetical protein [Candidatus Synoicihabitans sp.]